jgi:hypothetical protein
VSGHAGIAHQKIRIERGDQGLRVRAARIDRADLEVGTGARDELLIVVHRGKRIVEVMEQPFPFGVVGRLSEAFHVGGHAVPADEQQVLPFDLEAALQLDRETARRRRNERARACEGRFELRALALANVQGRHFENHELPFDESGQAPSRAFNRVFGATSR